MMKDYLIKSTVYDGMVRAYAIRSTNLVEEARVRQDAWATASAALGRTLTVTAMIGAMLKGDDTITVKIEGNGPASPIVCDGNAKGEVRGYLNQAHVDFPSNEQGKLDVKRAVGTEGTLSVVKDLGLKEYFTGQVPIVSGEISEDFTYYFASSEQTPSAVGTGVLVNPDHSILAAGGFIVQLMPGATDEIIDKLEQAINQLPPISSLIEEGLTPEEILQRLFPKEEIKFHEKELVVFKCKCSKERMVRAITGLGKAEVESMLKEDKGAEAVCHFCNEKYTITESELAEIVESI